MKRSRRTEPGVLAETAVQLRTPHAQPVGTVRSEGDSSDPGGHGDIGHDNLLPVGRGFGHNGAVGRDDLALTATIERGRGHLEHLGHGRQLFDRDDRSDLVGRNDPHAVLGGSDRDVQRRLVGGERVQRIEKQLRSSHNERARRLGDDAFHACIETDSCEREVNDGVRLRALGEMGVLVAHQHRLVTAADQRAVGTEQQIGSGERTTRSSITTHAYVQLHEHAVLAGAGTDRVDERSVDIDCHVPRVQRVVVPGGVVRELGEHENLDPQSSRVVDEAKTGSEVFVDVCSGAELRCTDSQFRDGCSGTIGHGAMVLSVGRPGPPSDTVSRHDESTADRRHEARAVRCLT